MSSISLLFSLALLIEFSHFDISCFTIVGWVICITEGIKLRFLTMNFKQMEALSSDLISILRTVQFQPAGGSPITLWYGGPTIPCQGKLNNYFQNPSPSVALEIEYLPHSEELFRSL